METVIKEVTTRKELKRFVKFPEELFKEQPNYIPPFRKDEMKKFSAATNPAYKFCEVKLWLAYQGEKVVGRVCGIVNHFANAKWEEHKVRFGWFDFIPDIYVCQLLLRTVAEFGREHRATVIHGPLGFTNMDKECWMIDHFDAHQNITTLYNPSYYVSYLQELGFQIDCEWQQYRVAIQQNLPESILRVSDIVKRKFGLRILKIKKRKEILPYAVSFFHTLNDSFKDIYGFIPLPEDEIQIQIKNYFSFINLNLVKFIVDENDEVVGFGLGIPEIGRACAKAKGRLFPFGWIHILRAFRHFQNIDLILIGVRPDWQNKGIHAMIMSEMHRSVLNSECQYAYTNPQITDFDAVKMWERHYDFVTPTCRRAIFSLPVEQL